MSNNLITQDIGVVQDYLAKRVNKLANHLLNASKRVDEAGAFAVLAELLDAEKARQASEAMMCTRPDPEVPEYLISSLTVSRACQTLTKTADEDLRFATGMVVAPRKYAITNLLEFKLKRKSPVFAEGDQKAVVRLMIGLHNIDHKLFMTLHCHPGSGPNSTNPSPTDQDFHRRLEAGKYPVIGAIVNRQGYVRFFSYQRKFKINIYGTGMEVISEKDNLFKLSKISAV